MGISLRLCVAAATFISIGAAAADPIQTVFTYQGVLKLTGSPLDDSADFRFALWDARENGNMVGEIATVDAVDVMQGLFTVQIDFGVEVFSGDDRYLEIHVRSPAGGGDYTTLTPRQHITPVPYALQTRGLFVDDDQDVGIGTTAPAAKLDVAGSVRIADGTQGQGKVLTSNESGVASWQAPPGGGFTNMRVFSTPGETEFTIPAGVTRIRVQVRGGGGGGGKGNAGGGAVGQGGSGGGYGLGIFEVTPDSVHTVTVGAGGTGADGGACTVGGRGGTSSFGSLIMATGGGGGGGCGSSSTPGTSDGPLSMTGEKGRQYFSSASTPENPGSPCGDGSTIGRGGNGNEFFGRDGNSGNVVLFW